MNKIINISKKGQKGLTGGRSRLASGLRGQLLPGGLSSGRLASGLFGASHLEVDEIDKGVDES